MCVGKERRVLCYTFSRLRVGFPFFFKFPCHVNEPRALRVHVDFARMCICPAHMQISAYRNLSLARSKAGPKAGVEEIKTLGL